MISPLSSSSLRRLSTLVLTLCVATATAPLPFEVHDSRAAVFGARGGAASPCGVLAHGGVRGGVRTVALGHGAAGAAMTRAHPLASTRTASAARAVRLAPQIVGEVPLPRPRPPRFRPLDAAPHQTTASTTASPRAPPRG